MPAPHCILVSSYHKQLCLAIQRNMWDSFFDSQHLLNHLIPLGHRVPGHLGTLGNDTVRSSRAWRRVVLWWMRRGKHYNAHIFGAGNTIRMTGRCMYCNHCQPCPSHIDIAAVTKFLDLAAQQDSVPETVALRDIKTSAAKEVLVDSNSGSAPVLLDSIPRTGYASPDVALTGAGSTTTNLLPRCGALSTQISPLCSSTMARTKESPSPAPPDWRDLDLSTRKKGSKICV